MAERLGHPNFCRVGGEECSYGASAYPVLPGSSPVWIQRTNVEAGWPFDQVAFYLSGLMDVAHAPNAAVCAAGCSAAMQLSPQAKRGAFSP